MFDIDDFIDRCRECLNETEPRRAIRETLGRSLADASAVTAALPPREAGLTLLYRSDGLTIVHVVWAPGMDVFAHDHRMWACIGIHAGTEDNRFFRRGNQGNPLVASGAKRLEAGEVTLLGDDVIHSVANPKCRTHTGALHVYGGDFVTQQRSQWVAPDLREEPYDPDAVAKVFADANETHRSN